MKTTKPLKKSRHNRSRKPTGPLDLSKTLQRVQGNHFRGIFRIAGIKPFDSSPESFGRALEHIGGLLTVAAADLVHAKAAIHCRQWREARTQIKDAFSEFRRFSTCGDALMNAANKIACEQAMKPGKEN